MTFKLTKAAALLAASTTALALAAAPAHAQDDDEDAEEAEVIVLTGARGQPRAVGDSAVPIDVIGEDEIDDVSFTDTNDIIQTLVPSYSLSRQPISDGATFIRPASLRGLPTDKTLVLVNSKRRHRAALVSIGGSGTQGPDIATIPATAIRTVEVLRDGAAAQYGTDAIAGVINFLLKEDSEGGILTAQYGSHYEGDGDEIIISANVGLPLGPSGFLSLSGEIQDTESTVRAEQYCESWFCLDPNGDYPLSDEFYDPDFYAGIEDANILDGNVVQPWGQPEITAERFFYNAGIEVGGGAEVYSFGNYSHSEGAGGFFYRYPGNGTIEDLRLEDGSIYSPLEKFPGGFTPKFSGEIIDYSVVGGLRGMFGDDISYDISARFGHNEIKYTLENTINPALGPDSPTSFKPGDLVNEETQIQADFSKEYEVGFAGPLVAAFGLSYVDESYEIVTGEPLSYANGPFSLPDPFNFCNEDGTPTTAGAAIADLDCMDEDDPVYTAVSVGSNGFPGYSPAASDTYERDSYAVYTELSADITDAFFLQGALRYEDYSDFGDIVIGKVAAQYDVSDMLSLRGSVSTGFRAPTPGQQGTTNVSTRLPNGFPVNVGLFPASSAVAQALGATELEPEESVNYSFGFVGDLGPIGYTIDFYRIELENQLYAISTLDVSTDEDAGDAYDNYLALVAAGAANPEAIGGVNYFTNAFDTTNQGVDLVFTAEDDNGEWGTTSYVLSVNYNESTFSGGDYETYFNAEDQYDFENGDPKWKGVFSADHSWEDFDFLLRATYYGPYENSDSGGAEGLVQAFEPELFIDLETGYEFSDYFKVSVGARNVFDNYPDRVDDAIGDSCCGRQYLSGSVVPWQGGYYYVKLRATY